MQKTPLPLDITELMKGTDFVDTHAYDKTRPGPSDLRAPRGDDDRSDSRGARPVPEDNPTPPSTGTTAPVGDAINPAHYRKHPSGIECIEVVRHMNFNIGNSLKYLWRYMDKGDPIENLQKAQWYIDDEIRRLQGLR